VSLTMSLDSEVVVHYFYSWLKPV